VNYSGAGPLSLSTMFSFPGNPGAPGYGGGPGQPGWMGATSFGVPETSPGQPGRGGNPGTPVYVQSSYGMPPQATVNKTS
jgi:hypothetical protein